MCRKNRSSRGIALAASFALVGACSSDDGHGVAVDGPDGESIDISPILPHFGAEVEVGVDGAQVVIRADGVPNHPSPYFPAGDARFETYNGPNQAFQLNPNRIAESEVTYRIPLEATRAGSVSPTPLGPIGVAVNGVPIFNQYAGPNQPLTREINSFDQYNGHPQQTGQYHYHVEPIWITTGVGVDGLVGVLLDGFPVYGPVENGSRLNSSDLDDLHGHHGTTAEFPDGIYHYHVTDDDPYINGAGFHGVPGTASR